MTSDFVSLFSILLEARKTCNNMTNSKVNSAIIDGKVTYEQLCSEYICKYIEFMDLFLSDLIERENPENNHCYDFWNSMKNRKKYSEVCASYISDADYYIFDKVECQSKEERLKELASQVFQLCHGISFYGAMKKVDDYTTTIFPEFNSTTFESLHADIDNSEICDFSRIYTEDPQKRFFEFPVNDKSIGILKYDRIFFLTNCVHNLFCIKSADLDMKLMESDLFLQRHVIEYFAKIFDSILNDNKYKLLSLASDVKNDDLNLHKVYISELRKDLQETSELKIEHEIQNRKKILKKYLEDKRKIKSHIQKDRILDVIFLIFQIVLLCNIPFNIHGSGAYGCFHGFVFSFSVALFIVFVNLIPSPAASHCSSLQENIKYHTICMASVCYRNDPNFMSIKEKNLKTLDQKVNLDSFFQNLEKPVIFLWWTSLVLFCLSVFYCVTRLFSSSFIFPLLPLPVIFIATQCSLVGLIGVLSYKSYRDSNEMDSAFKESEEKLLCTKYSTYLESPNLSAEDTNEIRDIWLKDNPKINIGLIPF